MNVKRTACILSAGALVTLTMPAFAERDGPRYQPRRDRDFNVQHRSAVSVPVHVERRTVHVERRIVHRPVHVERRVLVQRPVYVERPVVVRRPVIVERPVYVQRPVYPQPPVAYDYHPPYYGDAGYGDPYYNHAPDRVNPIGAIGGAVIGAAIGSQVGHGEDRGATTAIGAVIGGLIGSTF